jgi:tetratricopeptide (TPR) repeat protein
MVSERLSRIARRHAAALLRVLLPALLAAAASVRAEAALDAACAGEGDVPAAACLRELQERPTGEALAFIERWVAARRFAPALAALAHLQKASPLQTRIELRLHEVQSMADEAQWLARRRTAADADATGAAELTLAQTRCTRLSGEVALAGCAQALRERPQDARLLVAQGDALWGLGRAAEALASFRLAAQGDRGPGLQQKIALAEAALAPPVTAAVAAGGDKDTAVTMLDPARLGRYHALVIGIDAYRHLDRLDSAVRDARAIGELLRGDYGMAVTLLTDSTRADIVEVLDDYRSRLGPQDNLLIYYAGHGWLDTEADKGYWLPTDAHPDKRTNWVSNDTVRDALRALKAKHVLVVADSCFSGTLTRSGNGARAGRGRDYVERMARLKARQVLTSGSLEPVADSGKSGHSPFAAALMNALRGNTGILDATSLFAELRRPVALNSEQVPQFSDIRLAGHEGGDFLFVRRR